MVILDNQEQIISWYKELLVCLLSFLLRLIFHVSFRLVKIFSPYWDSYLEGRYTTYLLLCTVSVIRDDSRPGGFTLPKDCGGDFIVLTTVMTTK